jgi:putative phosphotransacetylase
LITDDWKSTEVISIVNPLFVDATMSNSVGRDAIEGIVREIVLQRFGARAPASSRSVPSALRVTVSARHMHVSQEDLEKLFGSGHSLTPMRPLYQEGQYAAEETITLVGPKRRLISNLRILGPVREKTQVELAFTDAITLGIDDLPVRISGSIAGTPGGFLLGPAGMLELKEGIIRAARHVHMPPADAEYYSVRQGDVMKLRVGGDAGIILDQIHVRVDPMFKLEVHLDTDEANACGLHLSPRVGLMR